VILEDGEKIDSGGRGRERGRENVLPELSINFPLSFYYKLITIIYIPLDGTSLNHFLFSL
jgi:hypothetical protein